MTEFPERFRQIREALGETQRGMSGRLGLGINTWQRYELGGAMPASDLLEKIVTELGVSPVWILTGQGAMMGGDISSAVQHVQAAAAPLDEELHARVIDGISRLYKEERVGLSAMDLGRLAARLHSDLIATYDDPADRLVGLKGMLATLRRQLREPARPGDTASTKRSA